MNSITIVNPGRLKLLSRRKKLGISMFTDHPTNSPGGYHITQMLPGKLLLTLTPMGSTFSRMGWMKSRLQDPLSGLLLLIFFQFFWVHISIHCLLLIKLMAVESKRSLLKTN